jgi:hypothetical protein
VPAETYTYKTFSLQPGKKVSRLGKNFDEAQNEKAKNEAELKQKQIAEKQRDLVMFKGMPLVPRSRPSNLSFIGFKKWTKTAIMTEVILS